MRIDLFDGIFDGFVLLAEKRLLREQPKFEPRREFEAGPEGEFEREKTAIQKAQEELTNFIQDKDEFDPAVFRNGKELVLDDVPWEQQEIYREFLKKIKELITKIAKITLPKGHHWREVFPPKAVWDRSHKNITFLRYDEMKKAIEVLMLEDIRRGIEMEVRRPGFDPKKKPTKESQPTLAGYFDLLMQTLRPLRERKTALEKREAICDRIDKEIKDRVDVGSVWSNLQFLLRDIQKEVEDLRVSDKEIPEKEEAWSKKLMEQEGRIKDVLLPKLQETYKEVFRLFEQVNSPVGGQELIRQHARRLSEFTVPTKDPDALLLQLREVSRMIEELRYYSAGQVRSLMQKTEFDIADVEGELFYRWLFKTSDRGEGTYVALRQDKQGRIEVVEENPIHDARKRIQDINGIAARLPDEEKKGPILKDHPQRDPIIQEKLKELSKAMWRIAESDRTSMSEVVQKVFRGVDDAQSVVHLREGNSLFHLEDGILRKATEFLTVRKIREMQDLLRRMGDELLPSVSQAFHAGDPAEKYVHHKNLIEANFGVMIRDSLKILQDMRTAIGAERFQKSFPLGVDFVSSLEKEMSVIREGAKVSIEKLEYWRKLIRETLFLFRCTLAIHFPHSLQMSQSRENEIRLWRERGDLHMKDVNVLDMMWQKAATDLFAVYLHINQPLPDELKEGEERGKRIMIGEWVQREIHDFFHAEAKKAGPNGPFLGDAQVLPRIIKLNKILDYLQGRISCRREFIAESLLLQNGEPQTMVDYPKKQGAVYQIYYDPTGSCFKFLVHNQEGGPGGNR